MKGKIICTILAYLVLILGVIFYKDAAIFISKISHRSHDFSIYFIGFVVGATFGAIQGLVNILDKNGN